MAVLDHKCRYVSAIKHASLYNDNLVRLKSAYHSRCLFNNNSGWLPQVASVFDDSGAMHGIFTAKETHQGYDGMMHGGMIASVVDASMVQCLMGHGIIGYTVNLSIKYRNPVMIGIETSVMTSLKRIRSGVLFSLECILQQHGKIAINASGEFYWFQKKA